MIEEDSTKMSLSKPLSRWFLIGSLVGTATVVAGWLVYKRRLRLSKGREIEKKLRQVIDRQLCFGRPRTTTVVVSSVDEWNAIEDMFLHTIDSTRIMGLDCEWLSEGKTTGKVKSIFLLATTLLRCQTSKLLNIQYLD